MSLRVKTAIILTSLFLILFIALHFVASRVLIGSFNALEAGRAARVANRAVGRIENSESQLVSSLKDWGNWDDTYRFAKGRNPGYVGANLFDSTFENLQLSLMVFMDSSGRVIYAGAFDLRRGESMPVPRSVTKYLHRGSPLMRTAGSVGLVRLPEGLLIVGSRPILTNTGSGPSAGTIVFGRFLDEQLLHDPSDTASLRIGLADYDGRLIARCSAVKPSGKEMHQVCINAISDKQLLAHTVLNDVSGKPVAIIMVPMIRNIHMQGMKSLRLLDMSLLLLGMSFLIAGFLMADGMVLKRLRRLQADLQGIDISGDLAERVEVAGSDELSRFAREVNVLLSNLQAHSSRNKAILAAIPDNIFLVDRDAVFVGYHVASQEHLAADPTEWIGRSIRDVVPGDVADKLLEAKKRADETGSMQCVEYGLSVPSGGVRQREARIVKTGDGLFLAMIRDVTERKQAEASLKMQISALNAAGDQVMIVDSEGIIEFVNPAFEQTTGYSYDDVVGRNWRELAEDGFRRLIENDVKGNVLLAGQSWHGELESRHKDGSLSTEDITITPIPNEAGEIEHYIAIKRDVTERKQYQSKLDQMAHHDALTGLPNRLLFSDRLTQRLADARRTGEQVAVMFLDLDRFKLVNDSLGHNAGDELLMQVSSRLQQALREADTVSRMGGDEFTIILSHVHNADEAALPARRILEVLSKPFSIGGHELYVTTSIGVSMYPSDGSDVESLVRAADTAMYHAKESGRNTYRFYTEQLNIAAVERMTLENYLRKAIEHDELIAYYQPRVCMRTNRLLGTEALIRWMHPKLNLMSPAQFIPLAEETGLVVPIGEWMLKTACRQNKEWQDAGLPSIGVGINVSARQFQITDLVSTVKKALDETGLDPQHLDLEITESTLITNPDQAVKVLKQLKDMGIRIFIDDFGTGYSSLSHLKHFPIDAVKIDKSFVRNITTDPDDAAIASAIVAMAHNLKLKVVAEGVETIEQLDFLRSLECDEMQGYFVGTPVPAEDLQRILETAACTQAVPSIVS